MMELTLSGCITFQFTSDGFVQETGWEAEVVCYDANACAIISSGASPSICFNNGTPSDPSDDYFEVDLNPTSQMSSTYTVTDASGSTIGTAGNAYGAPVSFGPFPVGADATITISDDSDPSCTLTYTIQDSGDCSPFVPQLVGSCTDFDVDGIPSYWVQSTTDNFDWTISAGGATPSGGTGPQAGDNTSGTGEFIFIETTTGAAGDIAQLSTALDLTGTTAPAACI